MNKQDFIAYLKSQTYDKLYQDINPISMIGYSKSFKTWNRIKNIFDWNGKSVIDIGCFHGYFCFRAEEAGASSVLGLDRCVPALDTARKIAKLEQSKYTSFMEWNEEDDIPIGDIALLLNVLHHFEDPLSVLRKIKSKYLIFEGYSEQDIAIRDQFRIIKTIDSHRDRRIIFLAEHK